MFNLNTTGSFRYIISLFATLALVFGAFAGFAHTTAGAGENNTIAEGTIEEDNLKLACVLSSITLKNVSTSSEDVTYLYPFGAEDQLTVSDNRGDPTGWKVKAKLSELTHTNGTDTLSGARLTIPRASSVVSDQGLDPAYAPVSHAVILPAGLPFEQEVLKADTGKGDKDWHAKYKNTSAQLLVKGDTAKAGEYLGEIVWTLEDTPTP